MSAAVTLKISQPSLISTVPVTSQSLLWMKVTVRWALTVCMLAWLPLAHGWSETGHRLTCDVAEAHVSIGVKIQIKRLMEFLPDEQREQLFEGAVLEFSDLCVWADKVRPLSAYRSVSSWHYVNFDRDNLTVDYDACVTGCVLTAIETHLYLLAQPEVSGWTKLQALMFLSHWVGDLHQPLHVSFADDLGGNRVKVTGYENCSNLHSVWDDCLIDETQMSRVALKGQLLKVAGSYAPGSDPILDWATESARIAIHPRTQYCRQTDNACLPWATRSYKLDPNYQAMNWPVAKERLARGGYRLAGFLNAVLGP